MGGGCQRVLHEHESIQPSLGRLSGKENSLLAYVSNVASPAALLRAPTKVKSSAKNGTTAGEEIPCLWLAMRKVVESYFYLSVFLFADWDDSYRLDVCSVDLSNTLFQRIPFVHDLFTFVQKNAACFTVAFMM